MRAARSAVLSLVASAAFAVPPAVTLLPHLPGDSAIAPAVNSQAQQSIARGGDVHLVAWTDYRGRDGGGQTIQSDADIFGMRLDASGAPLDMCPFVIAGGLGMQQRPKVAWNGENWLVLYVSQDPTGGYFADQLRAVRVSPGGQILDTPAITLPPMQFEPNSIGLNLSGQAGQWLITRCVYHNDGYGTFLGGQRIGANGQLLDATPIVLNDWVYGGTTLLAANGEYLAVGPDWNNSTTSKARRVGLNGQPIGASFNVPSQTIATNGSEYYVTWIRDFTNLVGSRMTATGTLLTPNGTLILPDFSTYNHINLAHDGTQWWLEWGYSDQLRTIRINNAGSVVDPGLGVLLPIVIGGTVNNAYDPTLIPRTGGGISVYWNDSRVALGSDNNVFSLPVSAANVPGSDRCVSTSTTNQRNPEITGGPGGQTAVAFVSEAANDDRVLVHFLSPMGNPTLAEPIEIGRGPTIGRMGLAWNGELYLAAWSAGPSGLTPTQIFARRFAADGTMIDAAPFLVMTGFNAAVGALNGDFLVAGARSGTYPQNIFIFANRIDGATGAVLDGASGLYLGGNYVSGAPRVRSDGSQWFVTAHSQWSHDSSQGDAIMARVTPGGAVTQAVNPTPVAGGSGDLDLAFSGSKYLLVWRMNTLSNANNFIAGRIMNADGTFEPGYFTIAEAPGRQLRPTVVWDGLTFVVAWDDQRNQATFYDARTDIYATRVSEQGVVLDSPAFAIGAAPEGDAAIALHAVGDGATLSVWSRFDTSAMFDSYRVQTAAIGELMLLGDTNCDGYISVGDISGFVMALTDPSGYAALFPACDMMTADTNEDGVISVGDIAGFVAMLMPR